MEGFAQEWERFEELHGSEMEPWEVPAMKMHYANTYRRLVGVEPDNRRYLRARLRRILGEPPGDVALRPQTWLSSKDVFA